MFQTILLIFRNDQLTTTKSKVRSGNHDPLCLNNFEGISAYTAKTIAARKVLSVRMNLSLQI